LLEKKSFNVEKARKFLRQREQTKKKYLEEEREKVLQKTISALRDFFKDPEIEVYLAGSILQPYQFTPRSDIDIVVKNFHGDRFELWSQLEDLCGREIDLILFEKCNFKEYILKYGYKVR
jgi:predicted nucleotidyltransferase